MPRTSGTRKGNGAGKGEGWGGAAKGAGRPDVARAEAFQAGNQAAAGYHDMSKSERIKKLHEMLYGLAVNAESEMVQLQATDRLLDRIEGKPGTTLTLNGDAANPVATSMTVTFKKASGG